jgi:hypothetical protein
MLKGFVSGEEKDIKRIAMGTRNLFPLDATKLHVGRIEDDGTIDYEIGTITVGTNSVTYKANAIWRGFYTDYIRANENEKLTFSSNDSSTIAWAYSCYDKNDNFLGKVRAQGTASIRTFTTLAGTKKVRISATSPVTEYTITNLMLNAGDTALPYEPYGYQEGWEVRDNQDRLIWGREDELQTATGTLPFKGYGLPLKVKSLLGNAVQNGGTTTVPQKSVTVAGIESGTDYAMFLKSDFPDVALGDEVNIIVGGTTHSLAVKKLDVQYVYVENEAV